ncbi:hypothetical protein [Stutzerimonas marianensis]|nr:hypothetical protein [Pseudomonas marianensis]
MTQAGLSASVPARQTARIGQAGRQLTEQSHCHHLPALYISL